MKNTKLKKLLKQIGETHATSLSSSFFFHQIELPKELKKIHLKKDSSKENSK